jgi:hypothetical protein
MKRNAKTNIPNTAVVYALCGDAFFDALINHPNVKGAYDGYAAAERRLGGNYAHGVFEFAGVLFENYQGTDDNSTVAIDTNEARFFWVGVPGIFAEYYAPSTFMSSLGGVGLPRYAKQVVDPSGLERFVMLHTQQNPLPVCLRPSTLVRGTRT